MAHCDCRSTRDFAGALRRYWRVFLQFAALALTTGALALAAPEPPTWIFLKDKGLSLAELGPALLREEQALAPRALARRIRVRGDRGLDVRDLPPASTYLKTIAARGGRIRAVSRWLNAVSVEADAEQRRAIAALPFVAGLRPVARGRRQAQEPVAAPEVDPSAVYAVGQVQLDMLGVPALHACGLTGAGVVIGVQDSGFLLTHQAFAGLEVVAARDFVQDDGVVADEAGDAEGQHNHGTSVLSLIVGQDGETFSGVAPGAQVLLAKTERVDEEAPYEEDLYVAGLEWLEGMGADLFTASLGYIDWYEHADLDGETAVVSQAAAVALANGLIMFTAVGNEGPEPGTLIAPADVDGIIAVGATNLDGVIVDFSSRGPTADGRIKPDLLAPGKDVWVVRPGTVAAYQPSNGTSLATPLAAGVGALLLEAYPGLDPVSMLALLRQTAGQSAAPDNEGGWGMIDGLAAAGLYCTCADFDGDGAYDRRCGGDDCDDADATTRPGAREVCDGRDNDCDGLVPADEVDGDGDGVRLCAGDCDDSDPSRHPGALEVVGDCIDNDCDGDGEGACEPTTGAATSGSGTAGSDGEATGEPGTSTGAAASSGASDTGAPATGEDGCGCATSGENSGGGWLLLLALAAWSGRRDRAARVRVCSRSQ